MIDIQEAKRLAYRMSKDATNNGWPHTYMRSPDVCTVYWTEDSWLMWIDWTAPANKHALQHAIDKLSQQKQGE